MGKITYRNNPLLEVICQLRFPTILSVESKTPADFQDLVRAQFPRYQVRVEKQPDGKSIKNHNFITEDGRYKISLTQNFIAFSAMKYTEWSDFAAMMDEPLGHFINTYKPSYFERIGLRYINAVNRAQLGLAPDTPWDELICDCYLGVLGRSEMRQLQITRSSVETELNYPDHVHLKMHAGPGQVQKNVIGPNGVQQQGKPETCFMLDIDTSLTGRIVLRDAPGDIEKLHGHASYVFADAITDDLHDAMDPVERE